MNHLKAGSIIGMALALSLLGACGGGGGQNQAGAPAYDASASATGTGGTSMQSASQQECRTEERNKALVRQIYADIIAKNNTALAQRIFSSSMVQHDASVADGPAGELQLIQNFKTNIPGMVATVKHISADGDYVAVHWQASATPTDEMTGLAVVDLYRLSNGAIVEHWDSIQPVPPATASGNSMFSDLYVYASPKTAVSEAQEEANLQMVATAYKDLFNNRNLALLDQYWDPGYIQHNPMVPNGTDGLKQLLQFMPPGGPQLDFFETMADGDLVYTFSATTMPGPNPGDPPVTGMLTDIFRVVGGKVVEHWDVQ